MDRTPKQLLENLTEPQREAVTHADGPLLVVAGPGSGKTRVITHRAAYLACTVTQPWRILAITFTNKAANEMGERMKRLGVGGATCATFHSFCARLLRIHGERVGLGPNFSIFDDADQTAAMKQVLAQLDRDDERFTPGNMLNAIGKAKNDMIGPDQYAAEAGGWTEKIIAPVYAAYEQFLAGQNAVDFDDLLIKTAHLLGDHPDLREQLEDRYRYVLVDEYQDTNKAQYLIARGLCLQHENLCVTGDPDQSIYAWRGANIQNILQFEEDFPKAKVVRLEQNYRSTPQILAAADAVIQNNRKRKGKQLWTHNSAGPEVRVAECDDGASEAEFVAGAIREHIAAGGTYDQVAIFYRMNSLSRNLEGALRNALIPYQVARGVAFFQRKEIKDTLAYLRIIANPRDQVALRRIINVPARGIGNVTFERVLKHAEQTGQNVMSMLQKPEDIVGAGRAVVPLKGFARLIDEIGAAVVSGGLKEAVDRAIKQSGLLHMWTVSEDDSAIDNVNELINFAAEYDREHADGSGSLTDWLQQINLVSDQDAIDTESGAVTLMTLHAAKGLEFDTVFIVGVEQGLLPHQRSLDGGDIEEERRLFFVGMTRAMRALTITSAHWRDFRGSSQRTSQSAFLYELPEEGIVWLDIGEDGSTCYDDEDDDAGDDDADASDAHAETPDLAKWQPGRYVRHAMFGIGRLLWLQPRSGRTHVGVRFAAYGEKTFILELAPLEPVEVDETDF